MVKSTLIAMILATQIILTPHVTTIGRLREPQTDRLERVAEATTIEPQTANDSEWYYYAPEPLYPVYEDERAVSVHCEEWELEELARLTYLEAGAQNYECQRAVCEVVFNQLQYGSWGATLHDVIFSSGNYEPAWRIPCPEPNAYIWYQYYDENGVLQNAYLYYDEAIIASIRQMVHDVYHNGIRIPQRVMFFRAWYYHQWEGAIPEFEIDGVYFSSSWWCQ